MNPREATLVNAAAVLLARHGQDVAYGPAHAVRDALALETEVKNQTEPAGLPPGWKSPQTLREVGAV